MKENIIEFLKVHLGYVLLIVCCIGILILWQHTQSVTNELTKLKSTIAITADINKVEAKLADMKQREAELYPVLQQKQQELTDTLKTLDTKKNELNKIKKEKIKNDISKMDINTLSSELSKSGYSNSIISK